MTVQFIICGNGHGIECVYKGLKHHGLRFTLCTEDDALKKQAAMDGIDVIGHYSEAINSKQDVVLTAAYKPKITAEDLKAARFVNIHYALLPKYRGMHAIVWAILNGESHVGFTLHETSPLLDQGAVIYQEPVAIGNHTSWELMMMVDALVESKIHDVLVRYAQGHITPVAQCEEDAIFVAPRNLEDCRVRWDHWNAVFFSRILQALVSPYPLPFFEHKEQKVEIVSASVIFKDYIEINGHVVYIDDHYVYVKIPSGLLRLEIIRVDGEEMRANQCFKRIGVRFGDAKS